MKTFVISTAALLLGTAAVAQTAAAPTAAAPMRHQQMARQPMTRAAVIAMVQDHFAKLDTNKDGFVSKAEADAAAGQMHERMAEHMKQGEGSMFDRLDLNHDGSISRAEFDKAHEQMAARMGNHGPMGGRMMRHPDFGEHMFEMADSNKDGRVSLQEATAAATAHFDKADTNHDGTVTPDEMRSAHQSMHGKPGRR